MTRPAFTLGPWKVGTHNPHSVHATGPRGFTLCDLGGIYPEKDANARLIAAAPELYAALRDATDALDYVHAIDSVTPPECDPDDGLCGAQFCAQNGCLVRKIAVARAALAKALAVQP